MNISVLDKLKPIIDLSIVSKFDIADMQVNSYIPVCLSREYVYVVVTNNTNQSDVVAEINKKLGTEKVNIKIISSDDFLALLTFVRKNLEMNKIDSDENSIDQVKLTINNENETNIEYGTLNIQHSMSVDSNNNADEDKVVDKLKAEQKFVPKKIGEVLVQAGLVTNEQIFNALVESKKTQVPLGTVLVQQGIISLEELKHALTEQQGYETVASDQLRISDNIVSMLPEDFIKLNKVIPISYNKNDFVVGMVNPNDKKVINDIVFLTGLKPTVKILTHYEFTMCMQQFFNEQKKTTDKLRKKIERQASTFEREENIFETAQKELKDDSSIVVKFVNKIIADAIDSKVSDIHIEPRLEGYVVRYRKDGILREIMKLPEKTESAILTRLKVISKMNIAEHRRPQDGSFTITYKSKDYDFRINTLPVGEQEKMVIRILAPAVSMATSKDEMVLEGASEEEINLIKKMESAPNGIILTTGPTGSGKTTTLYTLLKAINDEKINITTIEDPVEIRIDGINQSQINTKAGITFASCMRAILRQDPDVILVGEIRDIETLETAISAALTGHLVLSTLHTNSAAATITRMIDMGAKDYLVSSTLIGIIAQRLVRRLCPHCKSQYFPTREEAELVVSGSETDIQNFMKTPVYKSNGCKECNFEGYMGRMGVYEIMPITKEIKKLIAQGAHDIQIEEAAIGSGMKTLHQVCLRHIIEGKTTISEFLRVLGPVKE